MPGRHPSATIVSIIIVLTFLSFGSMMPGPQVEAGPGQDVFWDDYYEVHGNCSSRPTRSYFYVNSTALNLTLVVQFHASGPIPRADLAFFGPDSYVVDSRHITNKTYSMEMETFEGERRGHWSMSLTMAACGVTEAVAYTIWLNVTNRLLGRPVLNSTDVAVGDSLRVAMGESHLAEGESFMIELGDGWSSGWMTQGKSGNSTTVVTFDKAGTCQVTGRIRTADGRTTGSTEPVTVVVHPDEGGEGKSPIGMSAIGIMIAFILVVVLLLVAFVVGRY